MKGKAKYSAQDILHQLDECAQACTFPMLDNGYVYLGDVRLHAYRDNARWALLIEVLGYSPRAGSIDNCLHCYGNCLKRPPGTANEDFLYVCADGPDGPLEDEENGEYVRNRARSLRIRGVTVRFKTNPSFLAAKGIELKDRPRMRVYELLRSLLPEHRDLLLATEEELRQRVPSDLPCVLRLEEWHHPDLAASELPSQSETFRMIAEVLASGDSAYYRPTKPANTHWSNWPEGGTL